MINTILQFKIILVSYWNNVEVFLTPLLKNLDPSLFQNIILGVLAIFIPFAIVFLTNILNSKNEKRSEFEKMVLNDEVLGTKKIFWLAIIGVFFFAFFSGKDISISAKILSILIALLLISLFWVPFKKIFRFSEGYKPEFEIPFLKRLGFSRLFWLRNNKKSEKIYRAWNSFWSEKPENNERDFINIFISHIDDAIKHKDFVWAIRLSQIYVTNIEKRDSFSMGYEILPKIFEWSEILWNKEQLWLKEYNSSKKIQNLISQKHFPTFKNWAIKISNKINLERDRFWNWHYFGGEFFQSVIKILLKDGHGPYQLFTSFKKHIDESLKKLEGIENKEEKGKYDHYITGLFTSFCPTFFNEIDGSPSNYNIWENDFPKEWKISTTNTKNGIPGVILHEFIQWSRDRIFKDGEENYDKDLSDVINGIFPNVHSSLFTSFLRLFFSSEIKYALEKESNFYILGVSVSWSGSIEENDEDRDIRLAEMMREKEISQKEETIQIILNFFSTHWDILKITLDDNNKEKWEKSDIKGKEEMIKIARKEKLGKIKEELDSAEIKNICDGSEKKEQIRKNLLELINLLVEEIEKIN